MFHSSNHWIQYDNTIITIHGHIFRILVHSWIRSEVLPFLQKVVLELPIQRMLQYRVISWIRSENLSYLQKEVLALPTHRVHSWIGSEILSNLPKVVLSTHYSQDVHSWIRSEKRFVGGFVLPLNNGFGTPHGFFNFHSWIGFEVLFCILKVVLALTTSHRMNYFDIAWKAIKNLFYILLAIIIFSVIFFSVYHFRNIGIVNCEFFQKKILNGKTYMANGQHCL